MLHHIVFAKVGVPDYTCGGAAERFFAEGEERLALSLPRGYGYANKATDRWGLLYMLMNHKPQRLNGFIRYTVRYVTGERLTPVKPIWLDVRNCTGPDPVFDVPGGGRTFSTFTKSAELHDAAERPDRLWRRPSPRRRHPGRAAERDLRREALRVTPDLGRPEAEAASARARPDEDVLVPLGHRDPGRQGRPAPDQRGLRQLGAAHAGDGDHAPVPRARIRQWLRRDAGARRRPRPPLGAACLLDAAAPHAAGEGLTSDVDLRGRLQVRRRTGRARARHHVHVALHGLVPARRHRRRRPSRFLSARGRRAASSRTASPRQAPTGSSARCTRRRWCSRSRFDSAGSASAKRMPIAQDP